jgi:hypothetical protein
MKEGIMGAEVLFGRTTERETVHPEQRSVPQPGGWNPDNFAREQIRGLVRHVFFSNVERPVRQVIFSAVDPETDVKNICRLVGEALALETMGSIAVAGEYPQALLNRGTCPPEISDRPARDASAPLRQSATRVRGNLWLVPAVGNGDQGATPLLHSYLGEMRREYEFSVVEGPPAGESNEATAMAQFADGIILVLSALHTRRITARKIKETLEAAQARILGTVLCDRIFPIPERIYRRL